MLKTGLFRNAEDQQLRRERQFSDLITRWVNAQKTPPFSYGLDTLFLKQTDDPLRSLRRFAKEWMADPRKKLDYRRYRKPEITVEGSQVSFPSLLDGSSLAQFDFHRVASWRSGHQVGVIILKHWNAQSTKYFRSVNVLRNTALPISTAVFTPSYVTPNPLSSKSAQYEMLGPNVGQTIRRVWQDVLDIQYFADYLKNHQGIDEVGVYGFSIGSLRGFLASLFAPQLFDFAVFHFIADDFTDAFAEGLATRYAAKEMLKHIPRGQLREIWSVISPGRYQAHLKRMPRSTRIVQAKYDLVYGRKNVERFTALVRNEAPHVSIEEGDFGHLTIFELEKAFPMLARDFRFIYKNTPLSYF